MEEERIRPSVRPYVHSSEGSIVTRIDTRKKSRAVRRIKCTRSNILPTVKNIKYVGKTIVGNITDRLYTDTGPLKEIS